MTTNVLDKVRRFVSKLDSAKVEKARIPELYDRIEFNEIDDTFNASIPPPFEIGSYFDNFNFDPVTKAVRDFSDLFLILKPLNLTNLLVDLLNAKSFTEAVVYFSAFAELYDIPLAEYTLKFFDIIYTSIKVLYSTFTNMDALRNIVAAQSISIDDAGFMSKIIKFLTDRGFNPEFIENLAEPMVAFLSIGLAICSLLYMCVAGGQSEVPFSTKWFGTVSWAFLSLDKIPDTLMKVINLITKIFYRIFGLTYVPTVDPALSELQLRIDTLADHQMRLFDCSAANSAVFISDEEASRGLTHALSEFRDIMTIIPKIDKEIILPLSFHIRKITTANNALVKTLQEIRTSLGIKMVPVVVYVYGYAGAGKSVFTAALRKMIRSRLPHLGSSYTRGFEEFWSNYIGQGIVVYDDFNSTKEGKDLVEMSNIHSSASYGVPMADVSEKGRLFTSEIVIINSNTAYFSDHSSSDSSLVSPSILNRRRDILLQLSPKPGNAILHETANSIPTWEWKVDVVDDAWDLLQLPIHLPSQGAPCEDRVTSMEKIVDIIVTTHQKRHKAFIDSVKGLSLKSNRLTQNDVIDVLDNLDPLVAPDDDLPFVSMNEDDNHVLERTKFHNRNTNETSYLNRLIIQKEMKSYVDYYYPQAVDLNQVPLYLLLGPPGTGKSTAIKKCSFDFQVIGMLNWDDQIVGPYVLFDDITLSYEHFCRMIPIITSCADSRHIIKIFITANLLYKDYCLRYDSELIQAFKRRCTHCFKFRFRRKTITFHTASDVANCVDDGAYARCITVSYSFNQEKKRDISFGDMMLLLKTVCIPKNVNIYSEGFDVPFNYADNLEKLQINFSFAQLVNQKNPLSFLSLMVDPIFHKYREAIIKFAKALVSMDIPTENMDELVCQINSANLKLSLSDIELIVRLTDIDFYVTSRNNCIHLGIVKDNVLYVRRNDCIQKLVDGSVRAVYPIDDDFIGRFCVINQKRIISTQTLNIDFPASMVNSILHRFTSHTKFGNLLYVLGASIVAIPTCYGVFTLIKKLFNDDGLLSESWADDVNNEIPLTGKSIKTVRNSLFRHAKKRIYDDDVTNGFSRVTTCEDGKDVIDLIETPNIDIGDVDENVTDEADYDPLRAKKYSGKRKPIIGKKHALRKQISTDLNARVVAAAIVKNTVYLCSELGVKLCHAVILKNNIGITVKHVTVGREQLYIHGKPLTDIHPVENRDLVFFTVPDLVPRGEKCYRDITKHLCSKIEVDDLSSMQAMLFQKSDDFLSWQSVILKSSVKAKYAPFKDSVDCISYVNSLDSYNYVTSIQTQKGDCGGPVILINSRVSEKFIGIHSAASSSVGIIAYLTLKDFNNYYYDHYAPQVDDSDSILKQVGFAYDVNGSVRTHFEDGRTCLVPSPFSYHPQYDEPYQPAVMSKADNRIPEEIRGSDFMIKELMIERYFEDVVDYNFDENELTIVQDDISDYFSSLIREKGISPRVLTKSMAINGNTKIPSSFPMVFDSSPGYPFDNYGHKKADFFTFDGTLHRLKVSSIGRMVNDGVDTIINRCKGDRRPDVYFKIVCKDELRAKSKIFDNVDTRVIAVAPVDYMIAQRMYFYDVVAALTVVHSESPIKVGINPQTIDWNNNILRHLAVSEYGFDADYKKWDSSVPHRLMTLVDEIYCLIYSKTGNSLNIEMENKVRRGLGSALRFAKFVVGSKVFETPKGMVSGCPDTAIRNCLINFSLFYYVYRKLAVKNMRPDLCCFSAFLKYVCVSIYGDDNFCTISPLIADWFNYDTFSNEVVEMGFFITPADKGEIKVKLKKVTEMEFLKRNIVFNSNFNLFLGPLVPKSLDKMLTYTRTSRHNLISVQNGYRQPPAPDLVTLKQTAECGVREAALHGKDYYDKFKTHVQTVLNSFGVSIVIDSYSDMIRSILFDESAGSVPIP